MAKNILLFADGTGNVGGLLPDESRTNIYKLYRATRNGPDAERTIWAFEQALAAARVDELLVEHLLSAAICLVARAADRTPRDVLELYLRRSVPDEVWRERYLPLLD